MICFSTYGTFFDRFLKLSSGLLQVIGCSFLFNY
jgi:hypothetical protein